jgi:hypothetical protein
MKDKYNNTIDKRRKTWHPEEEDGEESINSNGHKI